MSPIRLIQGASFDADVTRLMGLAYEHACARAANGDNTAVRELIAKRIIDAARRGERDVTRLADYALKTASKVADIG